MGLRGRPAHLHEPQTFGSLAHWHAHLHVLVTDGGFRRDGSFVALPPPDPAVLEEAWRRAVLAGFLRQAWLEEEDAAGMRGAYLGPRIEA